MTDTNLSPTPPVSSGSTPDKLTKEQLPYRPKGWGLAAAIFGVLPHAIMAKHNWTILGNPDKGKKILIIGVFLVLLFPALSAFPALNKTMAQLIQMILLIAGIILSSLWGRTLYPHYQQMKAQYGFKTGRSGGLLYLIFFLFYIILFYASFFFA